jgi:sulfatase modifying factor 1
MRRTWICGWRCTSAAVLLGASQGCGGSVGANAPSPADGREPDLDAALADASRAPDGMNTSGDARQEEHAEGAADATAASCTSDAQCSDSTPYCDLSAGTPGACSGEPPSCAPGGAGMTNCGHSSESCCTSLEVAGGSFFRTYTNDGDGGGGEADPATVSGFRLDKYLVTVGRFRQFVNAVWPADGGAGWSPPAGSGKHAHLNGGLGLVDVGAAADAGTAYEPGWDATNWNPYIAPSSANLACGGSNGPSTWTSLPGSQENLPINCVNWYQAYAFCIWDGGFLASEAEWEYVAAGGDKQLEYPWGSSPPGTASQYAIYGSYYPSGSGSYTGIANVAPVGTATAGAASWGQLDMAGEFWQWNLDWATAAYVNPCVDCAAATGGGAYGRGNRGGTFASLSAGPTQPLLQPNYGGGNLPASPQYLAGAFRCARTPKEEVALGSR